MKKFILFSLLFILIISCIKGQKGNYSQKVDERKYFYNSRQLMDGKILFRMTHVKKIVLQFLNLKKYEIATKNEFVANTNEVSSETIAKQ